MPHALGLREGQSLEAKNPATVPHNLQWTGHPLENQGNNLVIPVGQSLTINNLKAGRYPVKLSCGMHPWMSGWVRIFDHPYFAVTDEQGRFAIKDAPAGPCRLMIRHSTGIWLGAAKGKNGRLITIQSGDNDLGALEYPAPSK